MTVILKEPSQIEVAIAEQPFADTLDSSRIHLVFTNDCLPQSRLNQLLQEDFGEELLVQGSECLYLYLPKEAKRKRLYTNYLEKHLGCAMTTHKLSVMIRLVALANQLKAEGNDR